MKISQKNKNDPRERNKRLLNKISSQKGSIIAMALIICASLAVVLSAIFQRIIAENNLNQFSENSVKALNVAEAGAEETLQNLIVNGNGLSGWNSSTSGGYTTKTAPAPISISGVGEYDVSVWDPTGMNPRIDVTGYVPAKNGFKGKRLISVVLQYNPGTDFPGAVVSQGDILVNSAFVDSYKSSVGPYGGANIRDKGNLYTKATATQSIIVRSGSIVKGKTICGETLSCTNPSNTIDIVGTVTGGLPVANPDTVSLPTVDPTALLSLSTSTSITPHPAVQPIIPAGNYKYSSIDLSDGDTLTFTGNANVYVDTLNLSSSSTNRLRVKVLNNAKVKIIVGSSMVIGTGALINENIEGRIPGNFSIEAADSYMGVGTQGLRIYGDAKIYGTIKAKNAGVDIGGNTEVFGAINSKRTIMTSGSFVHYDEDSNGTAGPAYTVVSWVDKGKQ